MPVKIIGRILVALLGVWCLVGLLWAGEQVIHSNKYRVPVVTLLDPDRTDASEYRYVHINSRKSDFSLVVNRDTGEVYQCIGQFEPRVDNPTKGCELVYGGPVLAPKK